MRTAVDSSVLLDVFQGHPVFGGPSREALRRAYDSGALVACEVVWAEVRAHFADEGAFSEALGTLGVRFDPLSAAASTAAGRLWRESRRRARGGKAGRDRVVADFLIGAHAQSHADALLTRDDGFYRTHFSGLEVVSPTTRPAD